ncbi:MAG: hypothetical protein F6K54_19580 [Okeania sp. SIO3B5]|uniref:hypothetical protein n=1 Tax=Okeania sp. SIO3B5 TaxID=2607811 RepID=UPI0013FEDBEF|nr:hypothetical protein [Okeania sp. SIO3B5]NEO55083.1 hypothetical protein [Okeania sp. SIO3B5]
MIPVSLVNNQKFLGCSDKSVSEKQSPLYQILIVEEETEEPNSLSPNLGLKTRVYTGNKAELKRKFEKISQDIDNLPNEGVNMDDVMSLKLYESLAEKDKLLFIDQYSAVRRLLQVRKISQLIAQTWLKDSKDKNMDIITKLLLRGNEPPDKHIIKNKDRQIIMSEDTKNRQMIIIPSQEHWQTICLNLFFCGQAYLKQDNKFYQLNPYGSIMSTYESASLYILEIGWDSFAGVMKEIQHTGVANPLPPYYKAVIPYPPRPDVADEKGENELSKPILTDKMIRSWAKADDVGGNLPFCEQRWNPDDGINIKYVVSPYPYMVASTCS